MFISIARFESDCHGGGGNYDMEIDSEFFEGLLIQPHLTRCLEGRVTMFGYARSLEQAENIALPHYNRAKNGILHYLNTDKDWGHIAATTTDRKLLLLKISYSDWQTLYKRLELEGIREEYDMKTYYEGIAYKRIILEWKENCDDE